MGSPTNGAVVGTPRPPPAVVGQTVAQSWAGDPPPLAGLRVSAPAAGSMDGARGYLLALRLDGQYPVRPPSPARSPAPAKLSGSVSRTCKGTLFALKTGSCSAGESTCVRSLASWPYSAPMQPGAIGQGHFHLPAPPMLRSRHPLKNLSLPPLCSRVPPMPGLETAQRQLLPDATLGDSQATLSKALTNRAPLGGAAPYFPIGCDSRPFLLTI